MLRDYEGNLINKYPDIVGDGVADDTEALQAIVDTNDNVILPPGLHIKITGTINIDTAYSQLFDGGNCEIIVSGDFPAFTIIGSVVSPMSMTPVSLNDQIINDEGSYEFKNIKIRSTINSAGTGILIDSCFKTNIRDCYIHNVKTGIKFIGRSRDIIIEGNQIYACWNYGLHFDGVNLHQLNIVGNHISCCEKCVYLDKPDSMANLQIVGNDIEVTNYPTSPLVEDDFECICIDSGDASDGILSEIVISGNTIQGHTRNNVMIEIVGGARRQIQLLSITGNHISNCKKTLIQLNKVYHAAIQGNTFANAGEYAIEMLSSNERITINGNICDSAGATNGGFIKGSGEIRRLIIVGNQSYTSVADPINLVGSVVSRTIVSCNGIFGTNTSVKLLPTQGAKNSVGGNICESGTYILDSSVTDYNNV